MQFLLIKGIIGLVVMLIFLTSRNAHHTKIGDKETYALPLMVRIFMFLIPFTFWIALALGAFNPVKGKPIESSDFFMFSGLFIMFSLVPWYFALYRVSTDGKAIYYAAFFRTVIPFENVTRIVENKGTPPSTNVYSKGHMPIYLSGLLSDYYDLLDAIYEGCPQVKSGLESNG